MYPSAVPLEEEIYYDGGFGFEYNGKVESNFDNKIRTTGAFARNLLMYRDSFGSSLLPFMAEPYTNALFSRSLTVQVRDFDSIKPDVFVMEKAERFLPQLYENAPKLPAIEEKGQPEGVRELAGAKFKIASSANGYSTITGTLADGTYGTETLIYVCVDGHWYEAYPCQTDGKEGFSLCLNEINENAQIKVYGAS